MSDPFEEIERRIIEVFSNFGEEIVDTIKSRISFPYPPASIRGLPPHLRTGDLRKGITWRPGDDGRNPSLTIGSSAEYSETLEGPLNRPFIGIARIEGPLLISRLQDAFG